MTNAERAARLAGRIADAVKRGTGVGLEAARLLLEREVKQALSVPAPKELRTSRTTGRTYYRVLTPAVAGAPPRLVTGKLQASVKSHSVGGNRVVLTADARSAKGFAYGSHHEAHEHPFVRPTAERLKGKLIDLVGRDVKAEIRQALGG
jgi:hypothetical protein